MTVRNPRLAVARTPPSRDGRSRRPQSVKTVVKEVKVKVKVVDHAAVKRERSKGEQHMLAIASLS